MMILLITYYMLIPSQMMNSNVDSYLKVLNQSTNILVSKLPKFVAKYWAESSVVVGSIDGSICVLDDCQNSFFQRIYFLKPLIGKLRDNMDPTYGDMFDNSI